MNRPILFFLLLSMLASFHSAVSAQTSHSFTNLDVEVNHLSLDIRPDFPSKTVHITNTMTVVYNQPGASHLILDVGENVAVTEVTGILSNGTQVDLDYARGVPQEGGFRTGAVDTILGQLLDIQLSANEQIKRVRVVSAAGKGAGTMWITPEQTTIGKNPMMIHLPEPSNARRLFPCQDRPDVKATFTATVRGLPDGVIALMAANNNPKSVNSGNTYTFVQSVPLPSYLYAHLMLGEFSYQATGHRTGVYCEAPQLEVAVKEYAGLEELITAGETLLGKFAWGRQDVLIFPALAFPYSAMETPQCFVYSDYMLTGGSQDLRFIAAHELVHAFVSNLRPNSRWSYDLAVVNEGATEWLREVLLRKVFPREVYESQRYLDYLDAVNDVYTKPNYLLYQPHTFPDNAFDKIAYHKGYLFWLWLEEQLETQQLLDGFRQVLASNMESLTTEELLSVMYGRSVNIESTPELKAWLLEGGIPDFFSVTKPANFVKLDRLIQSWYNRTKEPILLPSELLFQEKRYILDQIGGQGNHRRSRMILKVLRPNLNLQNQWEVSQFLETQVAHGEIDEAGLTKLMTTHSTLRLIKPLYDALLKSKSGEKLAKKIFAQAKDRYAERTRQVIAEMLRSAQ